MFRLLSNGMGGIDWHGLGTVSAWIGVADLDALMHRLEVIQHYTNRRQAAPAA